MSAYDISFHRNVGNYILTESRDPLILSGELSQVSRTLSPLIRTLPLLNQNLMAPSRGIAMIHPILETGNQIHLNNIILEIPQNHLNHCFSEANHLKTEEKPKSSFSFDDCPRFVFPFFCNVCHILNVYHSDVF